MSSPPPIPPRIIGRYALFGEIGSGGMAVVRFGKLLGSAGFSRAVAVKCLHPHFAKEAEFRKMFIDEARLASRIVHPNVVTTLDVVSAEGELFMVMEYVAGESLARLRGQAQRRGDKIPLSICLGVAQMVLFGLHAAHEAKSATGEPLEIVHRDVSPSNVLVGTDGIARVLDFGIARAASRLEATREGKIKGKLTYMAPEQLGGARVTRRADVYSASILLWELLTGQKLFEGADPHAALVEKLFRGPVGAPSEHRRDVTEAIDAVVRRGLERDPQRRFATAREMAIALELSGDVAGAAEIARWVQTTAYDAIYARAVEITRWESTPVVRPSSQLEIPPPPPSAIPAPAVPETGRPTLRPPEPSTPFLLRKPPQLPSPSASEAVTEHAGRAPDARLETPRAFESPAPRDPSRKSLASMLEPDKTPRKPTRSWAPVMIAAAVLLAVAIPYRRLRTSYETWRGLPGQGRSAAVAASPAAVDAPRECPPGMAHIPAARYTMGSDDDAPATRPAHAVTLATYCIDMHEVTVAEYKQCVDRGYCPRLAPTNDGAGLSDRERKQLDPACNVRDPVGRASHPMNCVDWESADTFCKTRGARLPTEAEWELAARGPEARRYPWGNDEPTPTRLNGCGKECADWARRGQIDPGAGTAALYAADDGYTTTAPVGSFVEGRSRYGIDDLAGNVSEWVADYFAAYTGAAVVDPTGPTSGLERVTKGGAFSARLAASTRAAAREHAPPEARSYAVGFRCAASLAAR